MQAASSLLPSPAKHNPLAAETRNVKSWIISPDGQSQRKSLQSSRPSLWLTGDKKVFLRRFKLWSSNMSTIIPNSPPSWTPCYDLPTFLAPTHTLHPPTTPKAHPALPPDESRRCATQLRRLNVNKLAHPHMTHHPFLPNMARNRTPVCPPLPSLITQHSWGAVCQCTTGAGVRLAQGQVTVIDRRMIDGCSWRSGSVFNCCWIGHFSPCKHVLRGASGWMTARRWKRRQTVSVKRGWAVELDLTDRTSGCLSGLLKTEWRP